MFNWGERTTTGSIQHHQVSDKPPDSPNSPHDVPTCRDNGSLCVSLHSRALELGKQTIAVKPTDKTVALCDPKPRDTHANGSAWPDDRTARSAMGHRRLRNRSMQTRRGPGRSVDVIEVVGVTSATASGPGKPIRYRCKDGSGKPAGCGRQTGSTKAVPHFFRHPIATG